VIGVRIGDWELEETKDGDVRIVYNEFGAKAKPVRIEICVEELEELGVAVESYLRLKGREV
jgi:hypothetical protein